MDEKGIILNNSPISVNTNLGGWIDGNPNFNANMSASKILNEVVGANRSTLNGFLEVAGQAADVIVANENGITCDGCGFINTTRGILTTGKPNIDALGHLSHFTVSNGDITIEGDGIDVYDTTGALAGEQLSKLDIISKAQQIHADIKAKNLRLYAGEALVSYDGSSQAINDDTSTDIAIDLGLLGGMYANQIKLIVNEMGAGVNLEGIAYAAEDIHLSAEGKISIIGEQADINANDNITINAPELEITSASLTSQNQLDLFWSSSTKGAMTSFTNQGGWVEGKKGVTIQALNIDNLALNDGADGGVIMSGADINFIGQGITNKQSLIWAHDDITINAGLDANDDPIAANFVHNEAGRIESFTGDINITADTINNLGYRPSYELNGYQISYYKNSSAAIEDPVADFYRMIRPELLGSDGKILPQYHRDYTNLWQAVLMVETIDSSALNLLKDDYIENGQLKATTANFWKALPISAGNLDVGTAIRALLDPIILDSDNQVKDEYLASYVILWEELLESERLSDEALALIDDKYIFEATSEPVVISGVTLHPPAPTDPDADTQATDPPPQGDRDLVASEREKWDGLTAGSVGTSYQILVNKKADVFNDDGEIGEMIAGGDIHLNGEEVNNQYALISAGGDIDISATTITNIAYGAAQTIHEVHKKPGCFACHTGSLGYRDTFGGVMEASGNIVLDAISFLNETIPTRNAVGDLPNVSGGFSNQQKSILGELRENAFPETKDGTSLSEEKIDIVYESSLPETNDTKDFVNLNNGLFEFTDDGESPYLIETNPRFTDYGAFLGSNYLIDRLNHDPEHLPRLLGDAWYETSLIRSQLYANAGRRYVTEGVNSDYAQIKALYDNAEIAALDFGLELGTALTESQIANLTDDIVWLETQMIDGEEVLVPQLYLANDDSFSLREDGALVAADDIKINALLAAQNNGTLRADEDVNIAVAYGDFISKKGAIEAGEQVALITGGNVTLENSTLDSDRLAVNAANDINIQGSIVDVTGDASLTAGGDVNITSLTQYTEGDRSDFINKMAVTGQDRLPGKSGTFKNTREIFSTLNIGGDMAINSGNDVLIKGGVIDSDGQIDIAALNDVNIEAVAEWRYWHSEKSSTSGKFIFKRKKTSTHTEEELTHKKSLVFAEQGINIVAGSDVKIAGSDLFSDQDVNLTAGDRLDILSVQDTLFVKKTEKKSGGFLSSLFGGDSSRTEIRQNITNRGAEINVVNDLTTNSGDDTTIQASTIQTGGNLNINVGVGENAREDAKLALLTATDRDLLSVEEFNGGLIKWTSRNYGHEIETIVHNLIYTAGDINIQTPGGITIEYKHTGDFNQDIEALSKIPGMEYMAELRQLDGVDWVAVEEIYKSWDESESGMSAGAMMLIAIAASMAIAPYISGLGEGLATKLGMTTTISAPGANPFILSMTGKSLAASANSGLVALSSQFAVGFANAAVSGESLGDVLKNIASKDSVKSLLATMITAGLTNTAFMKSGIANKDPFAISTRVQVGVTKSLIDSTVQALLNDVDLGDSLERSFVLHGTTILGAEMSEIVGVLIKTDKIDIAQQIIAHAIIGCVTASLGGAKCESGAVGAALGEAVADLAKNGLGMSKEDAAKYGQYVAMASSLITADEAIDITYTNIAATNAINNNYLLPKEKLDLNNKIQTCAGDKECIETAEQEYTAIYTQRRDEVDMWYKQCGLEGDCTQYFNWHFNIRQKLTEEGIDYFALNKSEFIELPISQSLYHNMETNADGGPINLYSGYLEGVKKYVHPIMGYEVVVDKFGNIMTDPLNMGTYNFVNPEIDGFNFSKFIASDRLHTYYDISPYLTWGNNLNDPSTSGDRLLRGLLFLIYLQTTTAPR